jgi:hypothetical protein
VTTIKRAETEEELLDIYRFRYRIYVEEMKRKQEYANHSERTVREPLDKEADILGIWDNSSVVGTVRLNRACASDLGFYSDFYSMETMGKYHPEKTTITTKLMIEKSFRNMGLAMELACALYELRRGDTEFNFIDCNNNLVQFFEFLGYRKYKGRVNHHEYGEVTPLVMVASDHEYLKKCCSPFVELCEKYPINQEAVEFFYSNVAPFNPE